MTTLVIEGPTGPRQIISAERSPRAVLLLGLMLGGLLLSVYWHVGTDPTEQPISWFYSTVGLAFFGLGALVYAWRIILPGTIRVELDRDGLVQRGLFWARRYRWQQIGPFAPVEETVRARWLPRALTTWHAAAFNDSTLRKLGKVRAPQDDELHAADISVKATLLEHGPQLKATRRLCDILNEWRRDALEQEPGGGDQTTSSSVKGSSASSAIVRRRVRAARLRIVLMMLLIVAFLACGPAIVAHWTEIASSTGLPPWPRV